MGAPPYISAIFTKESNFCDCLFAFVDDEAISKIRAAVKGRNLLLWEEQILSLRADTH